MTTIDDLRERLRIALQDPDAERWSDAALDRHLAQAVAEISRAAPRAERVPMPTTPGSRELELGSIAGLLEVARAEYPAGREPPALVPFSVFGSGLRLEGGPVPAGDDAVLWCRLAHAVDGAGSTLTPALEELAVLGASAFACEEAASGTIERLTLQPGTAAQYEAMARARATAFRQLLRELAGGRGRLRAYRAGGAG